MLDQLWWHDNVCTPNAKATVQSHDKSQWLLFMGQKGICWLSTGYMFSSTHFFRRESLLSLLSVKHAASYDAFKMVRCNVYVLCWCVFPHPLSFSCLWQGVETRFSVLSMQFRARHCRANSSLCYTSLFTCQRCILHVRLCCSALVVTCSVVRVLEYFVLSAQLVLT